MENNQMKGKFSNLYRFRSLLSELVRRDVKIKYRKSVLGILWSFLDPLLMMIVLTIVFSTLFHRVQNYPVFYLTGFLAYQFFRSGSSMAMKSMVNSSSIWKNIYVPKYIYALSSVLSNFITFLLSLVILFVIMLVLHVKFTVFIIFTSLPILALILMTFGAGLIMGTLNVFFRDIEHLYSVFMMLLMYGMPLFYPEDIVPAAFRFIQTYNPLYQVIVCLRDCFLYGQLYPMYPLIYAMVSGVILVIIGLLLLYRYQDKFILYI
ncbi:ABC transporter permease [Methanosphaera sp. WGK6]|uniref:ABC transporter permease n=1 Tax=Methanosphaera sp. WGK6 TaxID=1561964 RepID=UPI000A010FC5|nr:ABC transporter permease [Methanosphaera sp. WGK6]